MSARDPETWRAELDDGDVEEVFVWDVTHDGLRGPVPGFEAWAPGVTAYARVFGRSPHEAVLGVADLASWPLRAILAPGEATRAELVAQCDALQRAIDSARREGAEAMREACSQSAARVANAWARREQRCDCGSSLAGLAAAEACAAAVRALPLPGGET